MDRKLRRSLGVMLHPGPFPVARWPRRNGLFPLRGPCPAELRDLTLHTGVETSERQAELTGTHPLHGRPFDDDWIGGVLRKNITFHAFPHRDHRKTGDATAPRREVTQHTFAGHRSIFRGKTTP